jgi:hypothetical protein
VESFPKRTKKMEPSRFWEVEAAMIRHDQATVFERALWFVRPIFWPYFEGLSAPKFSCGSNSGDCYNFGLPNEE